MTTLESLQQDVELVLAYRCWKKENEAKEKGLEYKCTCPDPLVMTEEELRSFLYD